MKIVVDYDECASKAVCMGIAPEVFEVRDDGFLYVLNEHPGEELREKVRQAANGCPTGAITIVEDEEPPACPGTPRGGLFRSVAHRLPPCRECPGGFFKLGGGPPVQRHVRAQDRGYRHRAQ